MFRLLTSSAAAAAATALTNTASSTHKSSRCDGPPKPGPTALISPASTTTKKYHPTEATTTAALPVEEDHKEYIKGIKIYGIGIKEDPVPGEKRGKGIQHLTSSYWIYDMGVFIQRHFKAMQIMAKYAYERSEGGFNDIVDEDENLEVTCSSSSSSSSSGAVRRSQQKNTSKKERSRTGFDFRYFINVSNALFLKAEAEGLRTADGRDFFLMACWLAMAAAEVDGFVGGDSETATYRKYSEAERAEHRARFYQKYLRPHVVWDEDEEDDPDIEIALDKFAIECCRIDLLPTVALERLGVHNELCAIKWKDPNAWMREGFKISSRFDSMKRHYEGVHSKDRTEDHLAHLIWGFMAINHVAAVFPQYNDLTNFEEIRRCNVAQEAQRDPSLLKVVGDGGFRSGVPGRTRQSGSDLLAKIFENNAARLEESKGMANRRATTRRTGSFLFPSQPRG